MVSGSIPLPGTNKIIRGVSDNGSTGALQAFSRSSTLLSSTKKCIASSIGRVLVSKTSGSGFESLAVRQIWSLRLSVRIAACHAAGTGSTPVETAILKHILKSRGTFLKVDVNPVEGVIIGIVARENRGRVCFNMVVIPEHVAISVYKGGES